MLTNVSQIIVQAKRMAPRASDIIKGLAVARLISLLLIPAILASVADISIASDKAERFFIERAIDYYISNKQHSNDVGIVNGITTPVGPVQPYHSRAEFLEENPNCCRFSLTGSEGYYPSFWVRFWSGYKGVVILEKYFLRVNGRRIAGREIMFPVNSKGEVIVVSGFNGD